MDSSPNDNFIEAESPKLMNDIQSSMETVYSAEQQIQQQRAEQAVLFEQFMTPEQLRDYKIARERYDNNIAVYADIVARHKEKVNKAVLENGATLKSEHVMVKYVKGRTTWDGKKLDGYAAAHPEIEQFKKVGEPYTSWNTHENSDLTK